MHDPNHVLQTARGAEVNISSGVLRFGCCGALEENEAGEKLEQAQFCGRNELLAPWNKESRACWLWVLQPLESDVGSYNLVQPDFRCHILLVFIHVSHAPFSGNVHCINYLYISPFLNEWMKPLDV